MRCAFCQREMAYIHGHAACVTSRCPMYGTPHLLSTDITSHLLAAKSPRILLYLA
jgi:hypothetical protein